MVEISPSRCLRRADRSECRVAGKPMRLLASAIMLLLGLALGACSSVSGFVSDYWPTWAGGEPNGLPPRPGTPGYAEFVAHQAGKSPPAAPAAAVAPAGATATPVVDNGSSTQAVPPPRPRVDDQGAVQGGLY